jgi:hypothetical protein
MIMLAIGPLRIHARPTSPTAGAPPEHRQREQRQGDEARGQTGEVRTGRREAGDQDPEAEAEGERDDDRNEELGVRNRLPRDRDDDHEHGVLGDHEDHGPAPRDREEQRRGDLAGVQQSATGMDHHAAQDSADEARPREHADGELDPALIADDPEADERPERHDEDGRDDHERGRVRSPGAAQRTPLGPEQERSHLRHPSHASTVHASTTATESRVGWGARNLPDRDRECRSRCTRERRHPRIPGPGPGRRQVPQNVRYGPKSAGAGPA